MPNLTITAHTTYGFPAVFQRPVTKLKPFRNFQAMLSRIVWLDASFHVYGGLALKRCCYSQSHMVYVDVGQCLTYMLFPQSFCDPSSALNIEFQALLLRKKRREDTLELAMPETSSGIKRWTMTCSSRARSQLILDSYSNL